MSKKEEGSAQHTALYRKYRPNTLADVVGQGQVTEVLRRSLEQGKIAHAYLLTGPKGTGKTSIARILAHEINQLPYGGEETHLDIIEIDAASNNGVEDVRDLRDKVQLAPIASAKKVYIIDEVHMLSKPAFNALLKTLEEPPAHVVFILATTDLHKVPATIISRTQHFSFHSISPVDLVAQLRKIAKSEGMKVTDEALEAIASRGDGSFRNSISLLDQLSSFADDKNGITLELVQTTLGLPPQVAVDDLLTAIDKHDIPAVLSGLDDLEKQGIQSTILADQLIRTLRGRLAEQPQAVTLLDTLLEVSNSPQPQLKLLTILVAAAKPKAASTAAQTATKPKPTVLEAPVIVVEKQVPSPPLASSPILSESPRSALVTSLVDGSAPSSEKSEIISEAGATPTIATRASEIPGEQGNSDDTPAAGGDTRDSSQNVSSPNESILGADAWTGPAGSDLRADFAKSKSNDGSGVKEQSVSSATDFNWAKVLDYTKKNLVALHSVLNKCDAELAGNTLTLYTGRKFNKTKLDEAKYLTQLHEALADAGYSNLTIVTLAESKPPADEQLRKLAAIMGGGQEVSLE